MTNKITVENRHAYTYGNSDADLWVIQPVDERYLNTIDLELQEINNLTDNADFFLIAVIISDWNSELSPWQAAPVFGKESFGDGADATLSFIINSLIPTLKKLYHVTSKKHYVMAGYSLAGLFALWSGFRTELFSGIAAVSPSVWFPRFVEFTKNSSVKARHIYLSLGDKEAHTKNP
ncbi:MAG: alpha/beta hydrolase-fold protein, partial [Ruminococcus sp.]|nr:alpha/beta hydrolase-fold protein [Ruminococcus sp.]